MRISFFLILLPLFAFSKEIFIKVIVDENSTLQDSTIDLRGIDTHNITKTEIAQIAEAQKRELNTGTEQAADNRAGYFGIEPYKKNYILPLAYALEKNAGQQQEEAQFQISLKKNIWPDAMGGDIYIAYTQNSYWQIYDQDDSRPFRETNYAPEIYYASAIDQSFWGMDFKSYQVGYKHQSNGLGTSGSRSWDRLVGEVYFDVKPFEFGLTGWYRLPEDKKTSPNDPKGDDNPDIEDYIGYGQLDITLPYGKHQFGASIRNNLQLKGNNRGSLQLDYSYPIGTAFLYVQYFTGFDESLIDYDHSIDRIGIGFLFNR